MKTNYYPGYVIGNRVLIAVANSSKGTWFWQCNCGNVGKPSSPAILSKSVFCSACRTLGQQQSGDIVGVSILIDRAGTTSAGKSLWYWRCQCGNEGQPTTIQALERKRSCAECRDGKPYQIGDVVNNRKLIKFDHFDKNRFSYWIFQCLNCNKTNSSPVPLSTIKRYSKCSKCFILNQVGDISNKYVSSLKGSATKRGLSFEITPEDMWNLWLKQKGICALSGINLTLGLDASIDRIDSSEHYIDSNIQWVHKDVNKMKMNFNQAYFIEMCNRISENTRR